MNRFRKGRTVVVPTGPKLISVLSGKGGVGKSVIAFNLAERAASAGSKTLLVDADFCCGNLHILANVDPCDGLDAFVAEERSLNEAVCRCDERLNILGRSAQGPLADLSDINSLAEFVSRLRREAIEYDLVFIDQGSGISDTATLLASAADHNLVVMIPELTSIADSFGLCKYLYQSNPAIDCRILINRTESEDEAEYIWSRFAAMAEQFLGQVPVLAGSLPEDQSFRKAVAGQRAIAQLDPEVNVIQALTDIVRAFGGRPTGTGPQNSTPTINSTPASAEIRE